jgi:pimeloyl-ACP methyl ester carboxylesterase
MPPCHGGDRRFESGRARQEFIFKRSSAGLLFVILDIMPTTARRTINVSYQDREIGVSVAIAERTKEWIVALHGIQSSKALYEGLFNQEFVRDYSFVAIDFVGFGDSDKPDDFSYELQDQAEVVYQVLSQ